MVQTINLRYKTRQILNRKKKGSNQYNHDWIKINKWKV